jgi:hypothetical protein
MYSRRRWAGYLECMRICHAFSFKRNPFEVLGVDWKINLKFALKETM